MSMNKLAQETNSRQTFQKTPMTLAADEKGSRKELSNQLNVDPGLEANPWTIRDWTNVLNWFKSRAATQYQTIQQQIPESKGDSNKTKDLNKQMENKKRYFYMVKNLISSLAKLQKKYNLGDSDYLTIEMINEFFGDIGGDRKRDKDGKDIGGGGVGSEEEGRQRQILLSKPFTSDPEILPIKQLVYAYNLPGLELLKSGPEALLKVDVAGARSDSLARSLKATVDLNTATKDGGNFKLYITQLADAIANIKEMYLQYVNNRGQRPSADELRQSEWLLRGITTIINAGSRT